MTEYNYFCWSKEYNDKDSFQQKRYRVFNVEVSKEEYDKIKKIYYKLDIDKSGNLKTRFQTAFKKMWEGLNKKGKQEYFNIPHFNWEGFTFITGIKKEDLNDKVTITCEGKEVEISRDSAKALNLI